jgi:hypothetical protein
MGGSSPIPIVAFPLPPPPSPSRQPPPPPWHQASTLTLARRLEVPHVPHAYSSLSSSAPDSVPRSPTPGRRSSPALSPFQHRPLVPPSALMVSVLGASSSSPPPAKEWAPGEKIHAATWHRLLHGSHTSPSAPHHLLSAPLLHRPFRCRRIAPEKLHHMESPPPA